MGEHNYRNGYFALGLFGEQQVVFRKSIEKLIEDSKGKVDNDIVTGKIDINLKGEDKIDFLLRIMGAKKDEMEMVNWGIWGVKNEVSFCDKMHETSNGIIMPTIYKEFGNSIIAFGITTSETGIITTLYFHIKNKQ